jgi:hypothetical protein
MIEALLQVLKNPAYHFKRIGLEAGPLTPTPSPGSGLQGRKLKGKNGCGRRQHQLRPSRQPQRNQAPIDRLGSKTKTPRH